MKINLLLILLLGLMAMFMISCSDSDSNDDEVTIYQLPVFNDYSFRVYASAAHNTISVYSNGSVAIDTMLVRIDGQPVTFDRSTATYDFVEGQTYNIDVTINDTYHQAVDLEIVCEPDVAFPDTIQAGIDAVIEWDLDVNAKSQFLFFDNFIDGDESYYPYMTHIYLATTQRSFTMDADTFGFTDENYFNITLSEYNWITQGEFVFISYVSVYEYYGMRSPRI